MKRRIVSEVLAVVLVFMLLPVSAWAAVPKENVVLHRNLTETDEEKNESHFDFMTSSSDLSRYLYYVVPWLIDDGKVATSYNAKRDGSGTAYSLTSTAEQVVNTLAAGADGKGSLYAQWQPATGRSILYIGAGVGRAADGKDYILKDGLHDGESVTLAGGNLFPTDGTRKIIGWRFVDSWPKTYNRVEYIPGQAIEIDKSLALVPILGANYITYHYNDSKNAEQSQTEFHYWADRWIGDESPTDNMNEGSKYVLKDKIFVGWKDGKSGGSGWYKGYVRNAPHDLYAQYTARPETPYVILYNKLGFDDGCLYKVQALTADNKVEGALPAFPTPPAGYSFTGWYTSKYSSGGQLVGADTQLKSGQIIYARWNGSGSGFVPPATYAITFNYTVGKGILYTGADGKLTGLLPTPVWEGHEFLGWYTSESGGEKVEPGGSFTGDTNLYAHWKETGGTTGPASCTVTFDSRGGSAVAGGTVAKGGKVGRPADPAKTGFEFKGWFKEADCRNEWKFDTDTVEGDITLYAKWEEKKDDGPGQNPVYTVTFNANGGYGGGSLATGAGGKLAALPANPTRIGYTFDGWYTAASGGIRVTTATVFQRNTTVYAHWVWNPNTPSASYYQIYTSSGIYGGSLYPDRSFAVPGDTVTVTFSPWNNYELGQVSASRLDTGWGLSLTRRYGNEFTFVMPASDVQLNAAFTQRYADAGAYVEPAASDRLVANWYFSGGRIYHVRDGLVPTGSPLTRDMLVSVLYNMDGAGSEEPSFWAVRNNIVPDIFAGGIWGQDLPISREQTVMILYGYAGYKGINTSQRASLAGYADYSQIRPIARTAMSWARARGLVAGTSPGTLSPRDLMTCGQANTLLSRFAANAA